MTGAEALLKDGLRALFCIGLTQEFFSLPQAEVPPLAAALTAAFDDLEGRFGVKVLGTFDDDLLQVGVATGYPFISYILAAVPDMKAAVEVTNLLRSPYGDHRLARYFRMEARMGHELFFGTK